MRYQGIYLDWLYRSHRSCQNSNSYVVDWIGISAAEEGMHKPLQKRAAL